jgi:hypothetical protein
VKDEKRRGRPKMKWEKRSERMRKLRNVTPEKAVNRQIWRKATENQ